MYCKFCAAQIDDDCVICPKCGKQVGQVKTEPMQQPNVVINNENRSSNVSHSGRRFGFWFGGPCNKWVSFFLCLFLGFFGAHKFYEGRIGIGILYLCTLGLFGIGWLVDCVLILLKPNPYYVV